MSTKNPEAFRLVEEVEDAALAFHKTVGMNRCLDAKRALLAYIEAKGARIAELEALAAGYDAARLEIASLLRAQESAIGAGGMEPLRKRCLHQIGEPAQPVGAAIVGTVIECTNGEHGLSIPPGNLRKLATGTKVYAGHPAAQALDAARYQFLRGGEWRDTDLEPVIRLQLNELWDAKIDAAIAAQPGGANG